VTPRLDPCLVIRLPRPYTPPPMHPRDFRNHRSFPGLEGGPFEIFVAASEGLERLPWPIFAAILGVLAFVPALGDLRRAAALVAFFLGDWLLMALLPRLRISFGPARGPALALALLRVPAAFLPSIPGLLAQAAGTGLVVYGFYIEPTRLVVTRQRLRTRKWKAGPDLRLAHFGDLHMERVTGRDRRLAEAIRTAAPDIILISGDFLSYSNVNDPEAWDATRQVLAGLDAPLGVFAVSGSPPVDTQQALSAIFEGTRVRWLRDERVSLRHGSNDFDVIGISCSHKPFIDGPRLRALLPAPAECLTILLYHSPDLAPEAAALGIDLQLSGHTHGGQVRLPFFGAVYASSLYGKRFEVGLRRIGGLTLYVTRGLGMEGKGAPRVRFLSRPELTLWEISSEQAPGLRALAAQPEGLVHGP